MSDKALADEDIRDAIHAWIREDAPLTIKMRIEPGHVTALVNRLAALRRSPEGGDAMREGPTIVLRELSDEERQARASALANAHRREIEEWQRRCSLPTSANTGGEP